MAKIFWRNAMERALRVSKAPTIVGYLYHEEIRGIANSKKRNNYIDSINLSILDTSAAYSQISVLTAVFICYFINVNCEEYGRNSG